MYALNVARQILVSIPVGVAWVVMAGLLFLGWGPKAVEQFVLAWNRFTDDLYGVLHDEKDEKDFEVG